MRLVLPTDVDILTPLPTPGRLQDAPVGALVALASRADVIIGWAAPIDVIMAAIRLQFVAYLHHGIDDLPIELLAERNIAVANVAGAHTITVAEQAMAFMLAFAKLVLVNNEAASSATWQPAGTAVKLHGKTAVVIGLGGIGRAIATRCSAFGMRIVGVRRDGDAACAEADEVVPISDLHQALARADFVFLAVPLTAQTRGLIDAETLAAIPQHAYLINVARGPLVAEDAIYEALVEGRIGGYGTDVWWDYAGEVPTPQHFPVPSRLGVNRLPNVLGSGDRGGFGPEWRDDAIRIGLENTASFLAGRTPPNLSTLASGIRVRVSPGTHGF